MALDINVLKETIDINYDEMVDSAESTDDLLVTDFVEGLGYNRRKDKTVIHKSNEYSDWQIGNKIVIKVLPINTDMHSSEASDAMHNIISNANNKFRVIIVTNGIQYVVKELDSDEYIDAGIIDIEASELNTELLDELSKDKFDDFFKLQENSNTYNILYEYIDQNDCNEDLIQKVDGLIEKANTGVISNTIIADNVHKVTVQDVIDMSKKLLEENAPDETKYGLAIGLACTLNSSFNTTVSSESNHDADDYKKQIEKLAEQLSKSDEKVKELQETVNKQVDELSKLSGAEREKSLELLDMIEDDKDLPRSYVCVVNSELMQQERLGKFIGMVLQKLYDLKHFAAQEHIFNGDQFRLIKPAQYVDLIMGKDTYDIDTDGLSEDDALNKLRVIFSKFNDIIFECKKIGTLETQESKYTEDNNTDSIFGNTLEDDNEAEFSSDTQSDFATEASDNFDESTDNEFLSETNGDFSSETDEEFSSETLEEFTADAIDAFSTEELNDNSEDTDTVNGDFDDYTDDSSEEAELFEEPSDNAFEEPSDNAFEESSDNAFEEPSDAISGAIDDSDNSFDNSEELTDDIEVQSFNDDNNEQYSDQTDSILMVAQLLSIEDLTSNSEVNFKTVKYIGTNSQTFVIDDLQSNMTQEAVAVKCIDAVLAIESSRGNVSIINNFKQLDLANIGDMVQLYTEENKDSGAKINGTKYIMSNIGDIRYIGSILLSICNALQIDTEDIFVYFEASTVEQDIADYWGFDETAINITEYVDIPEDVVESGACREAIVKANMFSNIVVTKNSLIAHKNIIVSITGIKTLYMGFPWKMTEEKSLFSYFKTSIEKMIFEANNAGKSATSDKFGNIIGGNGKLVIDNPADGYDVMDNGMYLAVIDQPWQMVLALLKAQSSIFGDSNMALRLMVNIDAIEFYRNTNGDGFYTYEPQLSEAVSSFSNYIASNVKS